MMNQPSNSGQDPTPNQLPYNEGAVNQQAAREMTIPVIEESVQVDKRVVESGAVRITKVVSEQDVPVDIPLIHEEHDIQRVPVNEYVDTPPPPVRYEGDTMIIPVVREVLVVQKRLLVVEELHITKTQVEQHDTQQITLRKEEVIIERVAPGQSGQEPV
jgi:uncharacterized protein (TIGR02271 family)